MPIELTAIKSTAERILSHPTWDVILIFSLLAAGFFYGISAGKRRIAATILYSYVALAISSALPLTTWMSSSSAIEKFYIRGGVFLGLFLLLALTLGSKKSRGFAPASAWWQIFLLSFLQAGLLIHLVLGFLPPDTIKMLAPFTKNVFANPSLRMWWLILPIAVVIILRKIESREE